MGSGPSKPDTVPATQVWSSETPVRFSQDLVNSLQANPETDSTRAKTLELHVQSRVAAELKRLEESTNAKLAEIEAKISSLPFDTPAALPSSSPDQAQDHDAKSAGDTLRQLSRESVQNELQEMKKKLESRKQIHEVSEEVERAKSEVVRCLRDHDRRPLDCWQEVERFKIEVRRLEESWVDKIIR
ncbi:putative altered inheritance of mitochondria protein 13, mitochondrial [Xylogone sp. PMI_703]|nr:putative altered inheritance of mitochondria protein 13, mitochondrial [Xylogone sp. PMI_703]